MSSITGPWSHTEIETYLTRTTVPLRLASSTREGWPFVFSIWYEYRDGALWCATQERARVVRALLRDGRCGFEVAPCDPPYRGVRGRGRATIVTSEGAVVLRRLVVRYLGGDSSNLARWLLTRIDSEVAIRIEPVQIASWDYSERMSAPGPPS